MPHTLTIVGLGPGTWESLTQEVASALRNADVVYVRTAIHPSLEPIRAHLPDMTLQSFDDLYDSRDTFDEIYQEVVDRLIETLGNHDVLYAVPGSASLGETTVRLLLERVSETNPVRILPGLSFVEPVLGAVGVTDAASVCVIESPEAALLGLENAVGEVEGYPEILPWQAPVTTAPLLLSPLYDRANASGAKQWLTRFYPEDHPVQLVHAAGTPDCRIEALPLYEMDRRTIDHRTTVYVPPLPEIDNVRTFAGLMWLTRRLRGPGGCPWDREQTHATLKPHLLEETYEVLDALDRNDPALIMEELGDLLFQVTIHSQIAAEDDEFTVEDVIQSIMVKLIGRHPHVFGNLELESAQDVRHAWESFKQREKPQRASILEEIPRGLPALPQSNLMQKRVASVGFEWPDVDAVIAKVDEELGELRAEISSKAPKEVQREELGDIFFALVSVARHLRIDPEEALRLANQKFAGRFRYVESQVSAEGKQLRDLTPAELDAYWEEAKSRG